MIALLFIALGILTLAFIAVWVIEVRRNPDTPDAGAPDAERVTVGFFANFFDALGIGSFATSTTYFRLRRMVRDELIPGTLNVGHCLPTITQAFIGIAVIAVDPLTLVLMIVTAVLGAWLGAGVVSRMPRRGIQIGMAIALLIAAWFMFAGVVKEGAPAGAPAFVQQLWNALEPIARIMPVGGDALGVTGAKLAIALVGSFLLGTIMPLGIGYYAPCMVLIAMLGMNQRAAFPIMMGACAFLMPVASMEFTHKKRYSLRTAAGLAAGGIFGSALALLVVKSLPLTYVKWLVIVVIVYTGISLLQTAAAEKRTASRTTLPSPSR